MGPLSGVRIIELAGIGPGPFCGMILADMGAEVIRVNRVGTQSRGNPAMDVLGRNRRTIAVDLKSPEGVELILKLCETADGLIEGFRPGVTERLGLGPEECMARNERLVYGRMTGWGQVGPMAQAAGHDINYISLSGALHGIGREGEKPAIPLNLVGDFGGGGMLLGYGMVCGILEATKSGKGQVVDAAMVDGSATLMAMFFGMNQSDERGTNMLDGGAHFYNTYETSDGKWISVGSIEPQFYAELVQLSGMDKEKFANQNDVTSWAAWQDDLSAIFLTKTRDEWCEIMEGTDVCFAPVLTVTEAAEHPHNRERETFVDVGGITQPAPSPRFSRTAAASPLPAGGPDADSDAILAELGLSADEINALQASGVIAKATEAV